ncbi:MAG: threonine ammonia-lyase [Nitriliruptorales bacterium]
MVSLADVQEATQRIAGVAHRTPVVTSRTLDERTAATVLLKAENLQRAGSFKIRGAYNRIASLPDSVRERGVVAPSSGNHAQAVALAASLLATPATIVMPTDAPPEKRAATEGYGAEVVTYDRATEDRQSIAEALAEERGAAVVHPYEDPAVVAGQGTTAVELIEDAGRLDVLLVPVGGGGLIAGCAVAATGLSPGVRVFGVEPVLADDTRRSFEAGERVTIPPPDTIADGLRASIPGDLSFSINRGLLEGVVCVSEDEILDAMAFSLERLKLLVEPSGAVALAALLAGRVEVSGRRVGIVLSGGNIAPDRLAGVLQGRSPTSA